MVRQISIFTENKKGAMSALAKILSDAGIDIYSFVTNDSAEFGIVRMLVSDVPEAARLLSEAGYQIKQTSVIEVGISDETGSLSGLLRRIEEANVNIDYLYASFDRSRSAPVIIIHADEMEVLETLLSSDGYVCR